MQARELVVALAVLFGCGQRAAPDQARVQASAVAVGARAPDAQLTEVSGTKVALADVLGRHAQTVVVFYRGFW